VNEPSFRRADESDLGTLLQFMREYYAFDGHAFNDEKTPLALTALLRDPSLGRVWLILDDSVPVGYVVLCFGYSLEWLGRDAFIDEFFLREEYRGRGWGRKTLAFVEEAARSCNIRTLHLEVVRQNDAALKVYRTWGFHEHESTFMSKWIAQDFAKPKGQTGH
jgi:GNAT superfamily N-acetyltransferase